MAASLVSLTKHPSHQKIKSAALPTGFGLVRGGGEGRSGGGLHSS